MQVIRDQVEESGFDVKDVLRPSEGGILIGRFVGCDEEGQLLIVVGGEGAPVRAISAVPLGVADTGVDVVVARTADDRHPVIIGRVHQKIAPTSATVTVDGDHLLIQATRQIELKCGDASIVLTKAGKVLIRGNYVLSRSRGSNRIKGAFVDIN
jgi:hypothetical protein